MGAIRLDRATLTRADLLRFRRKVTAASTERNPKRAPVAKPPSGALAMYTGAMLILSADMDAITWDALREYDITKPRADGAVSMDSAHIRCDAPKSSPPYLTPDQTKAVLRAISMGVRRAANSSSRLTIFSRVAKAVTAHARTQWAAQVKSLLGIDLPAGDPDMGKLFDRFHRENTALITSLADDHIERVRRVLDDAGAGTRVEEIRKNIMVETGAVRSRATLIARDQVLSLNGDVMEARHKAAGVTEYVWRSSKDERVRKIHRELDGTRQSYADPPVVDERGNRGNPGQWWQCRCTAEPVIPGFDG